MRLPVIALFASVLLAASCARSPSPLASRLAAPRQRDLLYSGLVGQWRGTFEYRDPRSSTVLARPTVLRVSPAPDHDGLALSYRFPGDTPAAARTPAPGLGGNASHWHFETTLGRAQIGDPADDRSQAYTVLTTAGGRDGEPLKLVLEGDSLTSAGPVRIRQTIRVATGQLEVRQDVSVAGGAFMFHHAYVLTRAD